MNNKYQDLARQAGDRAGWWAVVLLLMLGATAYFTIFMIVFSFLRS